MIVASLTNARNTILLTTTRFDEMVAFYSDLFECQLTTSSYCTYRQAELTVDDQRVVITESKGLFMTVHDELTLCFESTNTFADAARLGARGTLLAKGPHTVAGSAIAIELIDPDKNVIKIMSWPEEEEESYEEVEEEQSYQPISISSSKQWQSF